MGGALKLEIENWDGFAPRMAEIVPLFKKTGVFRRHHVLNDPINFLDPEGLTAHPVSDGASTLNTSEGVQMLIDSYMNQSNGNVSDAWSTINAERNSGVATGDAAAWAEHYLWARKEVSQQGCPAAAQLGIAI